MRCVFALSSNHVQKKRKKNTLRSTRAAATSPHYRPLDDEKESAKGERIIDNPNIFFKEGMMKGKTKLDASFSRQMR